MCDDCAAFFDDAQILDRMRRSGFQLYSGHFPLLQVQIYYHNHPGESAVLLVNNAGPEKTPSVFVTFHFIREKPTLSPMCVGAVS